MEWYTESICIGLATDKRKTFIVEVIWKTEKSRLIKTAAQSRCDQRARGGNYQEEQKSYLRIMRIEVENY